MCQALQEEQDVKVSSPGELALQRGRQKDRAGPCQLTWASCVHLMGWVVAAQEEGGKDSPDLCLLQALAGHTHTVGKNKRTTTVICLSRTHQADFLGPI
jgi:hypothetical protein